MLTYADVCNSPHHLIRKRGLEVIEALQLHQKERAFAKTPGNGSEFMFNRCSDAMLCGICGYFTTQPRELAAAAGKLRMLLYAAVC